MCVCWLGSFVTIGWIFHTNPGVPLVFLTVGSSAGQLLLPYLYEMFISQFGWRGAFLIMGALALNCLPVGVLIHTSRKFYPTGSGSEGDKQKITGIFDVSLFKDPVIMLYVFNCLVIILTCKISSHLVTVNSEIFVRFLFSRTDAEFREYKPSRNGKISLFFTGVD